MTMSKKQWDLFICHASEDKDDVVRPLAKALVKAGLKVWYDEFTLKLGDRLLRSIDKGLSQSRYGLIILSPSFFSKEWPQKELDGLAARESKGEKVILPIWHNVDAKFVRSQSPILSGLVAVSTELGIEKIVEKVLDVVKLENSMKKSKKTTTALKRTESTRSTLLGAIDFLKFEIDRRRIPHYVKQLKFGQLKHMFSDVLDAVALFNVDEDEDINKGIFDFISAAILERNRGEGAELFGALLDWFFETTTPFCRYTILEIFIDLTKLSYLKKVILEKNQTGDFVAEFGRSDSYEIAGINAEILQNVKSLFNDADCREIVDFTLSNDQIYNSYRAQPYIIKLLPTLRGKVDPRKIERLHQVIG